MKKRVDCSRRELTALTYRDANLFYKYLIQLKVGGFLTRFYLFTRLTVCQVQCRHRSIDTL